MTQKLKRIAEKAFTKGYNDADKPENLKTNDYVYMADILNGFVDDNKIEKRKGYATIGNAPVSKAILGQDKHEPSGGTKYILRARNDATDANAVIEGWSGSGNWAALTSGSSQTASLKHEFIMAENATYIFNGTDTVLKTTNGTSVSEVATIPVGVSGKWWHNFLFVWGVTGNMSRLYFSDVNTPETFDGSNGYIDVNADDGEDIVGVEAIGSTMFIFKQTRVFTLTGYGTSDFTLADMGDFGVGIGTNARRSIISTGTDIYYLNFYGAVPHFRSITKTINGEFIDGGIISGAIAGSMGRMIKSQLSGTAGMFDGRRIWWSVCTSGTTNNEIFVYDTLYGGWTRHTGIKANVLHLSTIGGSQSVYFGSSTANGLSYNLDNSTTNDNGEAIDFEVTSPAYAPQPGYKSRYKYLYLTGDVGSDVDITVQNSPDGYTFSDLATVLLTGQGAAFGTAIFGTSKFGATTVARDRIFAGGTAYYMQYKFINNAADEDVAIRDWELFYQTRGLRDT